MMRLYIAGLTVVLILTHSTLLSAEDADFSEFDNEEFDVPAASKEMETPAQEFDEEIDAEKPSVAAEEFEDEETVVEVEEPGFDDFDTDEFESEPQFADAAPSTGKDEGLQFTKVPANLQRKWTSYFIEIILTIGMLIYLLAYLLGRSKNSTLAQAWYKCTREILAENFSIVGDDGSSQETTGGVLMKESDNSFLLWSTGRVGLDGLLVKLKFVKRQDLINILQRMLKPASDQLIYQATYSKEDLDNFVMCFAAKKSAAKLGKEMVDLMMYCDNKKTPETYGLKCGSNYQVLSEISDATRMILGDAKLQAFVDKYEGAIEYIHVSDQYQGEKPPEEGDQEKPREILKVLIVCFNVGRKGTIKSSDMKDTTEWTKLVLHLADKCRRYKLSKEGRAKSDKNRTRATENVSKANHQKWSELAQQRKEEKMKQATERYMNEDDPVKARKLEEKRLKKENQKKQKFKAVKIKSA